MLVPRQTRTLPLVLCDTIEIELESPNHIDQRPRDSKRTLEDYVMVEIRSLDLEYEA
jgi:hypothetical protein